MRSVATICVCLLVCLLSTSLLCGGQGSVYGITNVQNYAYGSAPYGSAPYASYPIQGQRQYVHAPLSLPVCPKDGYPSCENCRHGRDDDDLIMKRCCWDHYDAYSKKKPLREFGWYRFFGTSNLPPLYGRYLHVTNDPCTEQPMADIPNGPYIPPSRKKELEDNAIEECGQSGATWYWLLVLLELIWHTLTLQGNKP